MAAPRFIAHDPRILQRRFSPVKIAPDVWKCHTPPDTPLCDHVSGGYGDKTYSIEYTVIVVYVVLVTYCSAVPRRVRLRCRWEVVVVYQLC